MKFYLIGFLFVLIFNSAFAYQIQVVTDSGNVFTIQHPLAQGNGTGSGNGNGTGNGINAQIVTIHPQGTILAGVDNVIGNPSSLRPYNKVTSGTFAAGFQTSDQVLKMYIPKINSQYVYTNGILQNNAAPLSNILSPISVTYFPTFSGGSETTSINGLTFAGAGSMTDVLLSSGMTSSVITGSGVTNGGMVFVGSKIDPTVSITDYDGGTHGYTIFSSSAGISVSGSYTITIPVNKYVSSVNNAYAQYYWSYSNRVYCGYQVSCGGNQYYYPTDVGPATAVIKGYQSGNYYYVTSLSYTTTDSFAANYFPYRSYPYYTGSNYHPYFVLFDKSPFISASPSFTSDFQQQFNFISNLNYDLIVKAVSGGTTVTATTYDPNTQLFFKVTNLPPNRPFQILQNGVVGVQGITSPSGIISLSASQIEAGGQSSISGELDLYTNSPVFNSNIGTAIFDTVNNQIFNIPASSQQIYTPFAYVALQNPSATRIQNLIENSTSLVSVPYLSGTYNAGTTVMIPIIPGLKSFSYSSNGTKIIVSLASLPNNVGMSIITPGSYSNSAYNTNGSPMQISADTGGESSAIATKSGTMYALINSQVSADTAYTTSTTYNYQQTATQYIYQVYNPSTGWYNSAPCPQIQFQTNGCTDKLTYASSSAHAGPLSVYADIYVNGVMTDSQIIYYNQNPTIQQTSSVNNWTLSGSNAMAMHYPTSSATGLVQVPVHAGDLVEFYLRAHVDAYGDPISVQSGQYGVFTTTNQLCTASTTININNGSILTGMS